MFHIYNTKRTRQNVNNPGLIFDNNNLIKLAIITLKHLYPYNPSKYEFIDAVESITPSNFELHIINKLIFNIVKKDNEYVEIVSNDGSNYNSDLDSNYRYSLKVEPKRYNTRGYINRCKLCMINKCRYLLSFDTNEEVIVLPKVFYDSIPKLYTSIALSAEDKEKYLDQAIEELCSDGWLRKTGLGNQIEVIR